MKRLLLIPVIVLICSLQARAQVPVKTFTAGGYASWLNMSMFEDPSETWTNSAMLHNRLNFKVYPISKMNIAVELRNRFITGDMITLDPSYASDLSSDRGWFDMSWNLFSYTSCLLNVMVDRAYVDFTAGKLQVTVGRQRINWSQALVWNPNDIFNTYSFFDFDYVERPGSDAIRAVLSTGPSSAVEAVAKLNNEGRLTAAALYRFSLLNTDLQFLAGETDEELLTAGTGWSGAIGSWSIRGEMTGFFSLPGASYDRNTIIVTAGTDKVFSDKFSTLCQVMYSNNPVTLDSFTLLYDGNLTAEQLAFSKFSAVGQMTYTPMPLINISFAAIWYPDLAGWYAGPTIDLSLAENIDFSLVWQHFDSRIDNERMRINLGFLRMKYNF